MRQIGIRQFQQNFHKEIQDIPFVVTKHGKPLFNVVTFTNVVTLNEAKIVTTSNIPHRGNAVTTSNKENVTTPPTKDLNMPFE